jgi:Ca2+-binding RTX toxin-like protein
MAVITGSVFADVLIGTQFNDQLFGLDGHDVMIGGVGNDTMNGGNGFDIVDYSTLGTAVTLLPQGFISKGNLGTDRIIGVELIIGAEGQFNLIDGSSGSGVASFTIDLSTNSLTVNNVPGLGELNFLVQNFVDVYGTPNNDNIAGNNAANYIDGWSGDDILIGRGGNDTIEGGTGVDIIIGTDEINRGFGEVDVLIGGDAINGDTAGDVFVLGDQFGSYYKFFGNNDFAKIQDFGSQDLIALGADEFYTIQQDSAGLNIFVASNAGLDLIADVTLVSQVTYPTGTFTLASGQQVGNFIGV